MPDFCPEHSAHQRAIRVHDETMKEHNEELQNLKECIVRLTTLQEDFAVRINGMESRISTMEEKPAKLVDKVSQAVITALIGGVVGFVLASVGMTVG